MLCRSLFGCVVLGLCVGALGCGDSHHEDHEPQKLELRYHDKSKKQPEEINPKEAAHRLKVLQALEEGEAEELIEKKTVNLMKLRLDLGLWTLVVFFLLFLILRKAAWGPMLEGLHKREESILGALNEAEKARAEAKTLHDQFQKEMEKIGEKSRELMDEARRNAQRLLEDTMAKGKAEVAAERDRGLREIEREKDRALKDIWEQTAILATLVSAKTIKRDLGIEDHRRLVDESVAEMGKVVGDRRRDVWGANA
jgi:F-type H+-transporting ATPase subunit b